MGNQPARVVSVVVPASPQQTWEAVTDITAMRRRSPELVGMWFLGSPRKGRFAVNLNRNGWFLWPTTSRVSQWVLPEGNRAGVFAFTVWPTDVEWSYMLEPHADGTLLTQRRTAVVDASALVRAVARIGLGGQDAHDAELAEGMQITLDAIKRELSGPRA